MSLDKKKLTNSNSSMVISGHLPNVARVAYRALFIVNVVICLTYLGLWVVPSSLAYFKDSRKYAELEMNPYVRKKPFTLLVHKDFPRTSAFLFGIDNMPLLFKYDTNEQNEEITARICVGPKHAISISFTNTISPVITRVTLINDGKYYIDEGATGNYGKTYPR
jgi:hypothetical protein